MPRCEAACLSSGDKGIFSIYILAPTLLSLHSLHKSIKRPSLTSIIDVATVINFFESLASGMRCLLSNGPTTLQGSPDLDFIVLMPEIKATPPPLPSPLEGEVWVGGTVFSKRTGLFIFFSN